MPAKKKRSAAKKAPAKKRAPAKKKAAPKKTPEHKKPTEKFGFRLKPQAIDIDAVMAKLRGGA